MLTVCLCVCVTRDIVALLVDLSRDADRRAKKVLDRVITDAKCSKISVFHADEEFDVSPLRRLAMPATRDFPGASPLMEFCYAQVPEGVNTTLMEEHKKAHGFGNGYRAMCRFWSGLVYLRPELQVCLRCLAHGTVAPCAARCILFVNLVVAHVRTCECNLMRADFFLVHAT